MSWYRTGTIDVTNGSATVAGNATAFIANVNAGDALHGPDGNLYEITGIVSDTSLSVTPVYLGATQTAQGYAIQPTRGVIADLLSAVQSNNTNVTTMLGGPGAGKFTDGTLAQPGVRFTADENSGLRRAATDDIALVAGGADKLRLTGSVASGDAVQSSPVDATTGRLLKVGASATVLSASTALRATYGGTANAITLTTGASLASIPTGFAIRFRATAANTGATTINVDGVGAVAAKTIISAALPSGYIRTDADTVAIYDGTNWIVDRQIERGSNANGEYVRFADGTQECWFGLTTSASASVTWTYPAAFSTTPKVGASPAAGSSRQVTWQSRGATAVNWNAFAISGTLMVTTIDAMVTGRWF